MKHKEVTLTVRQKKPNRQAIINLYKSGISERKIAERLGTTRRQVINVKQSLRPVSIEKHKVLNQYIHTKSVGEIKTTLNKSTVEKITSKSPRLTQELRAVNVIRRKAGKKDYSGIIKESAIKTELPISVGRKKKLPIFRDKDTKNVRKIFDSAKHIIGKMENHYYKFYGIRVFNRERLKNSPKVQDMLDENPDIELNDFNISGINDKTELERFISENEGYEIRIISDEGDYASDNDLRGLD